MFNERSVLFNMSDKLNSNYILELKLKTNKNQEAILNKRFLIAENMQNKVIKYAINQINELRKNKLYKKFLKLYLDEKDPNLKKYYSDELTKIRKEFKLTKTDLEKYIKVQQHLYKSHIDSTTAQKLADNVWRGVQKVLFSNGKKLHFKKRFSLISLEGKSNKTGIMFKLDTKMLIWNNLQIPVKIRKNDLYVKEALLNPNMKKRIRYCRIIRKPFKHGFKYFLQIVLGGTPPIKKVAIKNKEGEITKIVKRNFIGKGRVGLDIGTSTIAITSKTKVVLEELAKNVKKYDIEIAKLSQSLERKRKQANPDNYNIDGTIKKGSKKWIKTKGYIKTLLCLKDMYRQKSTYIKLEHSKLANFILSLGTDIYVETMDFKALAKRAKKQRERSEKLSIINDKHGNKKSVYKYKKKKRFGKSITNKAPSSLISIIDRKLSYIGKNIEKINTCTFKASKYNHVTNKYEKPTLSDRWKNINGNEIQRDLYSAFLLMNSNKSKTKSNRKECISNFDNFLKLHNEEIERLKTLKSKGIKHPKSFGL